MGLQVLAARVVSELLEVLPLVAHLEHADRDLGGAQVGDRELVQLWQVPDPGDPHPSALARKTRRTRRSMGPPNQSTSSTRTKPAPTSR